MDVLHLPPSIDAFAPHIVVRQGERDDCRLIMERAFAHLTADKYHYTMPLRANYCAACATICPGDPVTGGPCRKMRKLQKLHSREAQKRKGKDEQKAARKAKTPAGDGPPPPPPGWVDRW